MQHSTTITIPGIWRNREEFAQAIAQHSGGYMFAGRILMDLESRFHVIVDFGPRQEELAEVASASLSHRLTPREHTMLQHHQSCVYVTTEHTDLRSLREVMRSVIGIFDAGGVLAGMENAGSFVPAGEWRAAYASQSTLGVLRSLSIFVNYGDSLRSFGMRSFGLPECVLTGIEAHEALELGAEFCCYLLNESPCIESGQSFGLTQDGPCFLIQKREDNEYPQDHEYHNPNGYWELSPVR